MKSVVVLESYALSAIARLKGAGKFEVSESEKDLGQAEILLTRSRTRVQKELLERAPSLKLVVTSTSGFDHIDWRACRERGIICAHTPGANAQSAAELTMTLLLAQSRNLFQAHKNVRQNQWRDGLPRPAGLEGQTLGIIGLGRVGRRVAKMAQTFGLHVIGYDPYIEESAFAELQVERIGMIELLRSSDIVSLHVPLTRETKHLLNQPTFKEMQEHALLINTCRGPVVDENNLMTALDEGTIAGAAMDVIEREPPPQGHRLLTHPRLLLTPHIGAYTESAWEKASHEAVEQVLRFERGEKVLDTLPLDVPWFEKT